MFFDYHNSVSVRHMLIIIILCKNVSQGQCLNIFKKIKSDLDLGNVTLDLKKLSATDSNILTTLKNLKTLPNNYIFTAGDISKNTDLYSVGLKNEDIYLNGTQLIQKYGHKVEEHHVTTSDGYILAMYRVPGKGRVVFLMHGLFGSFVDWLTVGPEQGLPYLLASHGYDVWMGNSRGNTFSRKHYWLSPSDPKFWEFSFNEIGSSDLPAMIDYVLVKTKKEKLTYIGHSQGTTSFFVLCSTKPEYNEKIDLMIAFSAIAWMKHIPNPVLKIVALNNAIIYELNRGLGFDEVTPDNNLKKALSLTLCGTSFLASIICQNVVYLMAGFNYSQLNYKQLPVIFKHFPAGASLTTLKHYAQLVVSGYFGKYDYGSNLNFKIYGSATPPSYPVDKINVPIAIFHSQGDLLANVIDVNKLRSKLRNVVDYFEIPIPSFNHVDYLWAKDVKKLVYDRVLTLIKQNFSTYKEATSA